MVEVLDCFSLRRAAHLMITREEDDEIEMKGNLISFIVILLHLRIF